MVRAMDTDSPHVIFGQQEVARRLVCDGFVVYVPMGCPLCPWAEYRSKA